MRVLNNRFLASVALVAAGILALPAGLVASATDQTVDPETAESTEQAKPTATEDDVVVDPNPVTPKSDADIDTDQDSEAGPIGGDLRLDTAANTGPINPKGTIRKSKLSSGFGTDWKYSSSMLTTAATAGVSDENGTWISSRSSVPGKLIHVTPDNKVDHVIQTRSRGSWSTILVNGLLIQGTNGPGMINIYDAKTAKLKKQINLQPAEIVMDMEVRNKNSVWVGTYSPNGARLLVLNLANNSISSRGTWSELYVRSLNQINGKLYIGLGAPARMLVYDGSHFRNVRLDQNGKESFFYTMRNNGKYVVAGTEPNANLLIMRQASNNLEVVRELQVDDATTVDSLAFYGDYLLYSARPRGVFYMLNLADNNSEPVELGAPILGEEYRDFSVVGDTLYAVGGSGSIAKADLTPIANGQKPTFSAVYVSDLENNTNVSVYGSEFSTQGSDWFDDKLVGLGHWRLSVTDPNKPGDYRYIRIPGEVKAHTEHNGTHYYGLYPYARIYKWEPNTNEPVEVTHISGEQSRPRAIAVFDDGPLVVSTRPAYGRFGGALTLVDLETNEIVNQYKRPFGDQTGASMTVIDDSLFVGTEPYGEGVDLDKSKMRAPVVAKFNRSGNELKKQWAKSPVRDATLITSLIPLKKGRAEWLAGSTNNGWVFVMEPDSGKVVMKSHVGQTVDQLQAANGRIYARIDNRVAEGDIGLNSVRFELVSNTPVRSFRVDSTGRKLSVVARDPSGESFVHQYVIDPAAHPVRIGGDNRFETAANAARIGFGSADTAILVNYLAYADQAAAMPLSKAMNAPLLLTLPDGVHNTTKAALKDLGVRKVMIVGGNGVVTEKVVTQLKRAGYAVDRFEGPNRFATAVAVAKQIEQSTGGAKHIYVATGIDYADPVVAAPAAAKTGGVVVYSDANRLGTPTEQYLSTRKSVPITAVGGPAKTALKSKGFKADTLMGPNRFATSVAVAQKVFPDATSSYMANGMAYSDAVVASALASVNDAPTVLNLSDRLTDPMKRYLNQAKAKDMTVHLIGGPGVLAPSVEHNIRRFIAAN